MEAGFIKANRSNFPKIDIVMLGAFFATNTNFSSAKFQNIKTSVSMEFALNVIFFVTVPCMIVYDAVKQLYTRFRKPKTDECSPLAKNNIKKCFSTQDMQAVAMRWRRRHGGLRKWMTPEAQELSKELWEKGLLPSASVQCEFMRPLLREGRHAEPHGPDPADRDAHDSCADSEQDDTDYVITQMQKSRESLSILKQKSKP